MYLTAKKFVPYEMKSSIIKVCSYENKNICGFLCNPFFEKDKYFNNITTLFVLIEHLQDELSFPQKTTEQRSFTKEDIQSTLDLTLPQNIKDANIKASFKINILFRQNASWQGSILWLEKGLESEFRSALELIFLLDSVLSVKDS